MYNAQEDMLYNFKLPKGKGSGDMSLQYKAFAFNESMTVAEGILEFQETVLSSRLEDQFESLGASCITIATFQHNDNNHSAASALNRVTKLASSPGFKLITTGLCNAKLLAKANELAEKDQPKMNAAEFDEKTKAVLEHTKSVAESISEKMVTKDELQHFGAQIGESSQKSSEELKSKVAEIKQSMACANDVIIANLSRTIFEHEKTIADQLKTVHELEKTIIDQQSTIENTDRRNNRQSFVLAKLNAERDEAAKELKAKDHKIQKLQEEINTLKVTYYGDGGSHFSEIKSMLTDLWEESKRRRV